MMPMTPVTEVMAATEVTAAAEVTATTEMTATTDVTDAHSAAVKAATDVTAAHSAATAVEPAAAAMTASGVGNGGRKHCKAEHRGCSDGQDRGFTKHWTLLF
jgi:hypothetical protein